MPDIVVVRTVAGQLCEPAVFSGLRLGTSGYITCERGARHVVGRPFAVNLP
jgi:hypothetical protein